MNSLKTFAGRYFKALTPQKQIIPKLVRLYSSEKASVSSEFDAVKQALKAAEATDGQIKTEKRLLLGFTCKICNQRTHRTMSHHAYNKGIVLIECSGCQSRHLIADHLGWFKDTPNAARRVEEMQEVGEIKRELKLSEEETSELV